MTTEEVIQSYQELSEPGVVGRGIESGFLEDEETISLETGKIIICHDESCKSTLKNEGRVGRSSSSGRRHGSRKKTSSLSRKTSETKKVIGSEIDENQLEELLNIPGFEKLGDYKHIKMELDWVNFKIFGNDGIHLYQTAQAHYCSLTVTGNNEVFIRKPNAENLLRIHSNIVEDIRYFHIYTTTEKYLGSVTCDVRQCFKLPAKLENAITRQIFNISVHREGNFKTWSLTEELLSESILVARIEAQIGHRWKSFYTLSFVEEKSTSKNQVLILGFLLALASVRLESELLPAILAVSAFLLTFLIFFIIQFT